MFDYRDIIINIDDCSPLRDDSNAYLYTDKDVGKKYVLKFIDYDHPKDSFFLIQEFRKLALLSAEPEIGTVYALVSVKKNAEESLCIGYLMDYIPGKTIGDVITQDKLNFDSYTRIVQQIAAGIEKAHHYGIIHNDLHGGNIILDSFNNIKIIDFLWNDYPSSNNDLQNFKKLESSLFSCLIDDDASKGEIIHSYCQTILDFSNCSVTISKLKDISFVLSHIDEKGKLVLGYLLNDVTPDLKLSNVLHDIFPDINEAFLLKEDTRYSSPVDHCRNAISSYIEHIFHQLNQANLCSCNVILDITPEKLMFKLIYNLNVTLFVWKSTLGNYSILPSVSEAEFKRELFKDEWVSYWEKRYFKQK